MRSCLPAILLAVFACVIVVGSVANGFTRPAPDKVSAALKMVAR